MDLIAELRRVARAHPIPFWGEAALMLSCTLITLLSL